MPYLVNIDLSVRGGPAGCHQHEGPHFDITVHRTTCGTAKRAAGRPPTEDRFWKQVENYRDARALAPLTKNGTPVLVRVCRLCKPTI